MDVPSKPRRSLHIKSRGKIVKKSIPAQRSRAVTPRKSRTILRTSSNWRFVGDGRIIDPASIDAMTFQRWKSRCENEHDGKCRISPAAAWLPPPNLCWLIDASRRCLVLALPGMPYIALSYVWGKVPMFKTLRANVRQLQEAGALSLGRQSSPIPRTILDAMTVVALIGERYLWVDSLCITQDDEEARHVQIKGMGSIYANASLTIIAEQGEDANFGLRGIPGRQFQPRTGPPERLELKRGWEIIQSRVSPKVESSQSLWHNRGWTFQEHLFSRRRLIFGNDRVRWECHRARWYDDIDDCSTADAHRSPETKQFWCISQNQIVLGQEVFANRYPDIGGYNYLVRHYNGRALSYPEDALAAFSGIITALSSKFAGGFICGIPVIFFDVALLWHGATTLDRRVSCKMSLFGDCLPSWSWAGWQGEVYSWSWFPGMDYIKYSAKSDSQARIGRRVIPVLQWFSKESIDSTAKPIQPSRYSYRSRFVTGDGDLPHGWIRHAYYPVNGGEEAEYPEAGLTPYFYTHESDPTTEFWYPIPLPEKEECPEINPVAPLISCRTLRTWLYLSDEFTVHGEPGVTIRDKGSRWAGMLYLPQPLPLRPAAAKRTAKNGSCELIMLSRGYAPKDAHTGERRYDEFQLASGLSDIYEYYNVLWIEWRGDIAYRKALSRIERKIWEREATE